jgi:dipeptidyl aminopeptidase/acylaminoacyl peptidase
MWPDTFVDADHNLNTAINKIREVLSDSAESPRFVETLPKRGYRFIANTNGLPGWPPSESAEKSSDEAASRVMPGPARARIVRSSMALGAVLLLVAVAFTTYKNHSSRVQLSQRSLTRLTFDDGLQIGATWSPDSRFIAYSSNRGGKSDVWVQQVSGGDPVQVTRGPGYNWEPDWSPDGKYIAYRSEDGDGGLFIVPALGGEGLSKRIAAFGYFPHWSPDGSQILFQTTQFIPWTLTGQGT